MAELMLINNLSSYDILFPGQEIKLRKKQKAYSPPIHGGIRTLGL